VKKVKIAILGSGNIATDLLIKTLRSPYLECGVFIGRNKESSGIAKAQSLGVPTSVRSIAHIINNPDCCEIVFDATSAKDHLIHAPILEDLGKVAIDLTPAKVGHLCVPAVNLDETLKYRNISMITCGGQASIPIAHAIGKVHGQVDYIEVISSVASLSAGPATRINLDEYLHTTEKGITLFSGAKKSKVILNLNPAQPCINMQTTILAKVKDPDIAGLKFEIERMVAAIQKYVPGYSLILGPTLENGRLVVMVRVIGLGDYLPAYAGNLDIINCAAIAVAERVATQNIRFPLKERREQYAAYINQ
jgi:acetaldehyde dehydrogenase